MPLKSGTTSKEDATSDLRQSNRGAMPQCSQAIDGYRLTFGPMKINYAAEGQMEKGKFEPQPEPAKFQLHGWSLVLYGEKS